MNKHSRGQARNEPANVCNGESPNLNSACSPAKAARWLQTAEGLESRLDGMLIDRYKANEKSGYPTLCKGRFVVEGEACYAIEEPTSLNTLELLPKLIEMGLGAVKIEGRQRSSAYVEQVTRVWRKTIDHWLSDPQLFRIHPKWHMDLSRLSEGYPQTLVALHRPWK